MKSPSTIDSSKRTRRLVLVAAAFTALAVVLLGAIAWSGVDLGALGPVLDAIFGEGS